MKLSVAGPVPFALTARGWQLPCEFVLVTGRENGPTRTTRFKKLSEAEDEGFKRLASGDDWARIYLNEVF